MKRLLAYLFIVFSLGLILNQSNAQSNELSFCIINNKNPKPWHAATIYSMKDDSICEDIIINKNDKNFEIIKKKYGHLKKGQVQIIPTDKYISFSVKKKNYLFEGNLYTNCKILVESDPTSFESLVFKKKTTVKAFDRRVNKRKHAKFFRFDASFKNANKIKIHVNTEFESQNEAEKQALKYGKIVGQLPNFLRKKIKTLTIHKGNKLWGGGNRNILIHIGFTDEEDMCVEEVMVHESGHTSLDMRHGGSISPYEWRKAAKADVKFISKYAKQHPGREDVAETILWWIAVRCKPNRLFKFHYKMITEGIPNRLKYFDEQNYDTYPLVCKK